MTHAEMIALRNQPMGFGHGAANTEMSDACQAAFGARDAIKIVSLDIAPDQFVIAVRATISGLRKAADDMDAMLREAGR